jgi:2'-5' RNA ligase
LFLAVWPPDDVVAELRLLHRKDQRGVRFVQPDNWHDTLRFLGECDAAEVRAALDGVAFEPTTARLGPAVDGLDERVLVVPVHGLDQIAGEVRARTRGIGEPAPKRYLGHLTVARVKPRVPMPRVLGALVCAEFDVTEVVLVQSRLHPDGVRYETIDSWPVG